MGEVMIRTDDTRTARLSCILLTLRCLAAFSNPGLLETFWRRFHRWLHAPSILSVISARSVASADVECHPSRPRVDRRQALHCHRLGATIRQSDFVSLMTARMAVPDCALYVQLGDP